MICLQMLWVTGYTCITPDTSFYIIAPAIMQETVSENGRQLAN